MDCVIIFIQMGKPQKSLPYRMDKLHGVSRYYNQDGKILKRIIIIRNAYNNEKTKSDRKSAWLKSCTYHIKYTCNHFFMVGFLSVFERFKPKSSILNQYRKKYPEESNKSC